MRVKVCQNCSYWKKDPDEDKEWGACRRHPPTAFYDASLHDLISVWPETDGDVWCGDHQEYDKEVDWRG